MSGSLSLRCLATSLALFTARAAEPPRDRLERNKAVARVVFEQILGRQWRVDLIDSLHTPDFVAHGTRRDSDLEDGRIREEWTVFDDLGLLRQLGLLPEPQAGSGR